MSRSQRNWWLKQSRLSRIYHIRDDWLTPVEYLPYIDALLGDIELDPCSTHKANAEYLRAKKIYTLEDDGFKCTRIVERNDLLISTNVRPLYVQQS
jgi:hypothetical protein